MSLIGMQMFYLYPLGTLYKKSRSDTENEILRANFQEKIKKIDDFVFKIDIMIDETLKSKLHLYNWNYINNLSIVFKQNILILIKLRTKTIKRLEYINEIIKIEASLPKGIEDYLDNINILN